MLKSKFLSQLTCPGLAGFTKAEQEPCAKNFLMTQSTLKGKQLATLS